MAKLLNVDALINVDKQILIGGKEYRIIERSVGQILHAIELSKKEKDMKPEEAFEHSIRMLQEAIPDCPREVLLSLPQSSLNAIFEFINEKEVIVDEEGKS